MVKKTGTDTKEKIIKIALDMFSRKGYYSVSIRDICKEVGIKESSVYYHFKSKQDILETVYLDIDIVIDRLMKQFDVAFEQMQEVKEKEFAMVGVGILQNYLLNENVYPVIRMLSIERLHDTKADEKYKEIVYELPLKQQEKVFAKMIDLGYFYKADVKQLAVEYHSIILYVFQRSFCGSANVKKMEKDIQRELYHYMSCFYVKYYINLN